jgi:hypothetical protein
MSSFDTAGLVQRFNAVEALQAEVHTHVTAIQELFARIGGAVNGGAVLKKPRQGGRTPVGTRRRGRRLRRAKRGALRAAIHQVLGGGKVLKAADVVKALPKAGIANPSYTSVYLALRKDKSIRKSVRGFKLNARGVKEAASKPAKE